MKRLFFDLDETLWHSVYGIEDGDGEKAHISFGIGEEYTCFLNPHARDAVHLAIEQLGSENVGVLTAATSDYASILIDKFDLPLSTERNFYHRAHLRPAIPIEGAGKDCFLIDNLCAKDNREKIEVLGLWGSLETNYFKTPHDFYGVAFDEWKDAVEQFIVSIE